MPMLRDSDTASITFITRRKMNPPVLLLLSTQREFGKFAYCNIEKPVSTTDQYVLLSSMFARSIGRKLHYIDTQEATDPRCENSQ